MTPDSRNAASRSAMRSRSPTSETSSTRASARRRSRRSSGLRGVLLDRRRRVLVPVALRESVVEVLPFRAHPADVEGEERLEEVARCGDVVREQDRDVRREIPSLRRPPRFAKPSSSIGRCVSENRSGEKKIGSQPSAISAASATFFGPIAAR